MLENMVRGHLINCGTIMSIFSSHQSYFLAFGMQWENENGSNFVFGSSKASQKINVILMLPNGDEV